MPSTTKAAKIAARMRMPWPLSDSWNTCAVPWKPVEIVAGRKARREVERNGHGRLLALVVDKQRPDRRHRHGHGGQRDRLPGRNAVPGDTATGACRRGSNRRGSGAATVGLDVD